MYIFLLSLLFLFGCSDVFDDEEVYGCTDDGYQNWSPYQNQAACNYNPDATKYWEGSCEYDDDDPYYDCDGNCTEDVDLDGICDDIDFCAGDYMDGYSCGDLDVFYDLITVNYLHTNFNLNLGDSEDDNGNINSNNFIDIYDISSLSVSDIFTILSLETGWFNSVGKLDYLSLNDKNIYFVPESIGNLDALDDLFLSDNVLSFLPSTICDLNDDCEIFVQDNRICDAQHQFECIDGPTIHFGSQECNE